uniref:Secreted protein n=1 Tax=Ixodes ricinus TaxID=34613 RepID=A0A147BDE4_IXORI
MGFLAVDLAVGVLCHAGCLLNLLDVAHCHGSRHSVEVGPRADLDALAACRRARGPLGPLGHRAVRIDHFGRVLAGHYGRDAHLLLHELERAALPRHVLLVLALSDAHALAAGDAAIAPLTPRRSLAAHATRTVNLTDVPVDELSLAVEHERLVPHQEAPGASADALAARHAARAELGPLRHGALGPLVHGHGRLERGRSVGLDLLVARLLVDALPRDRQPRHGLHGGSRRVIERRVRVVRVAGRDLLDPLLWGRGLALTDDVGDALAGASVPRVQVHGLLGDPRAVLEAQLERAHADNPVRTGAQHGEHRHHVVLLVQPEHGERLAVHVWIPQAPGLDDGPDLTRLCLEFGLEFLGGTMFGDTFDALGREPLVLPHLEVGRVGRADYVRKVGQPLVVGKSLGMRVSGP